MVEFFSLNEILYVFWLELGENTRFIVFLVIGKEAIKMSVEQEMRFNKMICALLSGDDICVQI
jgi:hypothetical protein